MPTLERHNNQARRCHLFKGLTSSLEAMHLHGYLHSVPTNVKFSVSVSILNKKNQWHVHLFSHL